MICHNHIYTHHISFDNGSNYTELDLAKFVKFTFKKEKGQEFYRIKSSAWKILRGWNAGVYDGLKGYIDAPDTVTSQIKLKTNLLDSSGTLVRVYFNGFLSLPNCEIDADGEGITFTPDTNDDYTWYDSYKTIKYDPMVILGYDQIVTYETEPTRRVLFNNLTTPSGYIISCGDTMSAWTPGRHYTETDFDYDDGLGESATLTRGWCTNDGGKYYQCILENNGTPATEPTGVGNSYWTQVSPPPDAYVQQYSELPFDNFLPGNGIYDTGYPVITAAAGSATNCDVGDFYLNNCTTQTEEYTVANRARKLMSFSDDYGVLNQMLLAAGQTYTIDSDFFSDATNPVSSAANKLLNLIICTKEAIINGVDSSNVNDGLTFEQLFTIFREVFNCYWYITGGVLYIEHLKFFEDGLSYGGSPSVGVDLTSATYSYKYNNTKDPNGDNRLNEYSFGGSDFPEREVFKLSEQLGTDGFLEYTSKAVEIGKEVVHNAQVVTTDIELVVKFPEQVDENGWALIACDPSNVMWKRNSYKDGYTPGGAVGDEYTDVINGDLYWDNLLTDWWRYGCALTNIKINGTATTALSLRRSKKQEKVMFLRLDDLVPTELVTTHIGDGEIETMEVNTETDWITVSLLYEL